MDKQVNHMRKQIFFSVILSTSVNIVFNPAYAAGLKELEDVTIQVIELNQVPGANVELIKLPEPDLGEMHDRTEGVRLPKRTIPNREAMIDASKENATPTTTNTNEGGSTMGTAIQPPPEQASPNQ